VISHENAGMEVIFLIGGEIGVSLQLSDVSAIHRLRVRRGSNSRKVIARFVSREKKMEFLTRRKKLKKSERFKTVFISIDLTKLRFKLFQLVRKSDDVKNAFRRDGRILGTLQNGTKFSIESPDDLFRIGVDEIDYKALGLAEL
jgi:hypothetical protein